MALCLTKSLAALTGCSQFNLIRILLVPAGLTSSYCDRCFSTAIKLTMPFRVTVYGSARKKLLKSFCGVLEREHWHEQCMFNSVSLLARTMHSSSCLYLAANWVSNSRLLKSCCHTFDAPLQSTLNSCSATLKHVHNSRTIGSKNNQKWSISGVVQQLVCNHSDFIVCLL